MIQAIALDDDCSALTTLDAYCQRASGITLQQVFTQPRQALHYIQRNQIDLVFTETQLTVSSGVEFWQSVRRWATDKRLDIPKLVFTTIHPDYAVLSYELQALDYLLKPISFGRFAQTIQKASAQFIPQLPAPLQSVQQRCFRVDYGLVNVNLADIACIEALGNYCKLYLTSQRPLVVRSTMKLLLHDLPPRAFVQVHRSFIVATSHIQSVRSKQVFLADKHMPVGTRYERAVYRHLSDTVHSSQV